MTVETLATNDATRRHAAPDFAGDLVLHEARLLNERRFEEWIELLTDDIVYFAAIYDGQKDGINEAAIFYDDLELITTRINRLRHPKIWSQLPPAITMRLVSNVAVESDFSLSGLVYSNFIMLECRSQEQKIFGGNLIHKLVSVDGTWKIARKTVQLVNSSATHSNIGVPF